MASSNPGPFDVILANAVLQWVPDHETLLPNADREACAGRQLGRADNLDESAHLLMHEIAADGPWAG